MTELEKAIKWLETQVDYDAKDDFVDEPDECEQAYLEHMQNCRALLDALRWVPVSERKPTNADSDESGQVIAFSRFGCCIVHWTTLSTRTPFTHWRPLPAPPESEG